MSATIPPSHLDLITGPVYAVLTTVTHEGQPENTIVWCSWDGTHVVVNSVEGRRKVENVRHNPRVAITAIDPHDPYRWVDVRGYVEEMVPDPEYATINAHAKLYVGVDEYYGGYAPIERRGTEKRIDLKIRPTRVLVYPRHN
ncbi:PPOX class F420-dependent oxidoreductase [Promineifilum sp.]|uniref:PPOX class F420-dependent oxidoreductase n=1 Tax=Promineifilum sp. TaxID=2664178 RepID=UPI0035B33F6B